MLLGSTFLGAIGQLFFKSSFVYGPLFIPLLAIGILMYLASTVIYFYVLSRVHLSWAYSLGGISYIFTVIFAAALLQEAVPPLRWAGVGVIAVGVLLIGLS
jgi:drug/metabolite transporter (DMT)-like permease